MMRQTCLFVVQDNPKISFKPFPLKRSYANSILHRSQIEEIGKLLYYANAADQLTVLEDFFKLIDYFVHLHCGNNNPTPAIQAWISRGYKKLYERRNELNVINFKCITPKVLDQISTFVQDLFERLEEYCCDDFHCAIDFTGLGNKYETATCHLDRVLNSKTTIPLVTNQTFSLCSNSADERRKICFGLLNSSLSDSFSAHQADISNYIRDLRYACLPQDMKNYICNDFIKDLTILHCIKISEKLKTDDNNSVFNSSLVNTLKYDCNLIRSSFMSTTSFSSSHDIDSCSSSNDSWNSSDFENESTYSEDSAINAVKTHDVTLQDQNSCSSLFRSFHSTFQTNLDASSDDSIVFADSSKSDCDEVDGNFSFESASNSTQISFYDSINGFSLPSVSMSTPKKIKNLSDLSSVNRTGSLIIDSSSEDFSNLNVSEFSSPHSSPKGGFCKSDQVSSWLESVSRGLFDEELDADMNESISWNPMIESICEDNEFKAPCRGSLKFADLEPSDEILFSPLENESVDLIHNEDVKHLNSLNHYDDTVTPFKNQCFMADYIFPSRAQHLKTINEDWNEMMDVKDKPCGACKVSFVSDQNLVTVHFFKRTAEEDLLDIEALDRARFKSRIHNFGLALAPFLTLDHRTKVFQRNHLHKN